MYFDSLHAALYMEGHGLYVWPIYGLGLVLVILLVTLPRRRERRLLRQLAGEMRRREARGDSEEG